MSGQPGAIIPPNSSHSKIAGPPPGPHVSAAIVVDFAVQSLQAGHQAPGRAAGVVMCLTDGRVAVPTPLTVLCY